MDLGTRLPKGLQGNKKRTGGGGLFLEIIPMVIGWMHLRSRSVLGNQKVRGRAVGQ